MRDDTPHIGHGDGRIAFIDTASTGNVLIELAELPPGHYLVWAFVVFLGSGPATVRVKP